MLRLQLLISVITLRLGLWIEESNLTPCFRVHLTSKAINVKRVIPTFSVNGVYSCQLSSVSDQLAMGYGNGDVEVSSQSNEFANSLSEDLNPE